jgi:segregation and condensation protein A
MSVPENRPEPAAPVYLGPAPPENGAAGNGPGRSAAEQTPPSESGAEDMPVEGRGPRVSLERFEGPLDLLLYLVREDELDIGDIPIARITEQYLELIDDLSTVDLELAGEYLVMATTLMRIKAKMLLPREEEDEEEDEADPRRELLRRMLEYREFKRVAEGLGERQDEWREIFRRASAPLPELEDEEADDLGVGIMDLCRAFRDVLARVEKESPFAIQSEDYSIEEQMDWIREECSRHEDGVPFLRLFEGRLNRSLVITTFLALLEMVRQREIVTRQVDRFGEIWIHVATEAEPANES